MCVCVIGVGMFRHVARSCARALVPAARGVVGGAEAAAAAQAGSARSYRVLAGAGADVLARPGLLQGFAARPFSTVDQGCRYAESHEWAKLEGGVATIGISDFAQAELGDVAYVDMPGVGDQVKAGETFGVVESTKAASDVYSPISGEVVEVNEALVDSPGMINDSPFSDGWIMKVKPSDEGEMGALMDAAKYEKFCAEKAHCVRTRCGARLTRCMPPPPTHAATTRSARSWRVANRPPVARSFLYRYYRPLI